MQRTGLKGALDVLPLVWQDMMSISTWTFESPSWMFCLTSFFSRTLLCKEAEYTPEDCESVGVYKHGGGNGLICMNIFTSHWCTSHWMLR